MMFAQLVLEKEPPTWADLPGGVVIWVQNAGAVAALALAILWLAQTLRPGNSPLMRTSTAYGLVLRIVSGVCFFYFVATLFALIASGLGAAGADRFLPTGQFSLDSSWGDYILTAVGAWAMVTVLAPFVAAMVQSIRLRRIWAIARVSLKEAVRGRVIWVFSAMALIFLFADWFVSFKPEDQIRNYVRVLYWSMIPLFLMVATLLGSFGIPNDVKNQSIHTIVTKPVERFEIVLGRFIGYGILITVGLAGLTVLSLIYVIRGVHPDAAQESYRARVPLFGTLSFIGTGQSDRGENAGNVWDYRSYIAGPDPKNPAKPRQYAIWAMEAIPAALGEGVEPVQVGITFDIFRLHKGEINKGIYCTFWFIDGRLKFEEVEKLVAVRHAAWEKLQNQALNRGLPPEELEAEYARIKSDLAHRYGVHEERGFELKDNIATQEVNIPPGLFKKLNELESAAPRKAGPQTPPQLRVVVSVDRTSPTQLLGVARRDLYLLIGDNPFWLNFVKGVMGMWFSFLLILGVAVAVSTYLSGVISWLVILFLYLCGLFSPFIDKLAQNRLQGGGPLESFFRLTTGKVHAPSLEESSAISILQQTDALYRWWLRRFLNLLPDVNRFDLHQYVANGFDIPWGQVILLDNLLPLIAYLLPWGLLAFYLMKFREIADPT